jgi:hypothetical protein
VGRAPFSQLTTSALLVDMPKIDRDAEIILSAEEVRTARKALALAIYHRGGVAARDDNISTLTGQNLVQLTKLMADIDNLTESPEGLSSEAHHRVLAEHLEKAMVAYRNNLISAPSRLAWLLEEAHNSKVPVPPELENLLVALQESANEASS